MLKIISEIYGFFFSVFKTFKKGGRLMSGDLVSRNMQKAKLPMVCKREVGFEQIIVIINQQVVL